MDERNYKEKLKQEVNKAFEIYYDKGLTTTGDTAKGLINEVIDKFETDNKPLDKEELKSKFIKDCTYSDNTNLDNATWDDSPIEVWKWIEANCLNKQADVIKSVCDKHDWQLIAPNSSRCRKCGAV
jgi:hypothetical protein